MKLRKFYASKVDPHILERIDEFYRKHLCDLARKLEKGTWSAKQKKWQRRSILPNIALYQTFLQYAIEKEEALELVRARAYHKAEKLHSILKKLFCIPQFSKTFRNLIKKACLAKKYGKV